MEGQRKSRTARARSVRASSSRSRAAMKSLDRSVILSPCCPITGLLFFRYACGSVGTPAGMIMDGPGGWKALSRETDVRKYAHPHGGVPHAAFCERKSARAL